MKRTQLFVILIALIVAIVVNFAIIGWFSTAHAQDTGPRDCYIYDPGAGDFVWVPCPTPTPHDCYIYKPSAGNFVWVPCVPALRPARGFYPIGLGPGR